MQKRFGALLIALGLTAGAAYAQTLYGAAGSSLYSINTATGAGTLIGPLKNGAANFSITGLATHPSTGVLYGTTKPFGTSNPNSLVTVNTATGLVTVIGPLGVGGGPFPDITFTSSGQLFGWSTEDGQLASINIATGNATLVGVPSLSNTCCGFGIATAPNGTTLYLAPNAANGTIGTISTTTGVFTPGPTLTGAPSPNSAISAMKFSSAGVLYASNFGNTEGGPGFLVTINTTTGAVTNIGALPSSTDAIAFAAAAVVPTPTPTPPPTQPAAAGAPALSTWAMAAAAILLGWAGFRFLRRPRAS